MLSKVRRVSKDNKFLLVSGSIKDVTLKRPYKITNLICMNKSSRNIYDFLNGENVCTPMGNKISKNIIKFASRRYSKNYLVSLLQPLTEPNIFPLLHWLNDESNIKIISHYQKNDDYNKYECEIRYVKGEYLFRIDAFFKKPLKEGKDLNFGTTIIIRNVNIEFEKLNETIIRSFSQIDGFKIISTNKSKQYIINQRSITAFYRIGETNEVSEASGVSKINEVNEIRIDDDTHGITIKELLNNLLIPSTDSKFSLNLSGISDRNLTNVVDNLYINSDEKISSEFLVVDGNIGIYSNSISKIGRRKRFTYILQITNNEMADNKVAKKEIESLVLKAIDKKANINDLIEHLSLWRLNNKKIQVLIDHIENFILLVHEIMPVPVGMGDFYNQKISKDIKNGIMYTESKIFDYQRLTNSLLELKSFRSKDKILIPLDIDKPELSGLNNVLFVPKDYPRNFKESDLLMIPNSNVLIDDSKLSTQFLDEIDNEITDEIADELKVFLDIIDYSKYPSIHYYFYNLAKSLHYLLEDRQVKSLLAIVYSLFINFIKHKTQNLIKIVALNQEVSLFKTVSRNDRKYIFEYVVFYYDSLLNNDSNTDSLFLVNPFYGYFILPDIYSKINSDDVEYILDFIYDKHFIYSRYIIKVVLILGSKITNYKIILDYIYKELSTKYDLYELYESVKGNIIKGLQFGYFDFANIVNDVVLSTELFIKLSLNQIDTIGIKLDKSKHSKEYTFTASKLLDYVYEYDVGNDFSSFDKLTNFVPKNTRFDSLNLVDSSDSLKNNPISTIVRNLSKEKKVDIFIGELDDRIADRHTQYGVTITGYSKISLLEIMIPFLDSDDGGLAKIYSNPLIKKVVINFKSDDEFDIIATPVFLEEKVVDVNYYLQITKRETKRTQSEIKQSETKISLILDRMDKVDLSSTMAQYFNFSHKFYNVMNDVTVNENKISRLLSTIIKNPEISIIEGPKTPSIILNNRLPFSELKDYIKDYPKIFRDVASYNLCVNFFGGIIGDITSMNTVEIHENIKYAIILKAINETLLNQNSGFFNYLKYEGDPGQIIAVIKDEDDTLSGANFDTLGIPSINKIIRLIYNREGNIDARTDVRKSISELDIKKIPEKYIKLIILWYSNKF